MTDPIAEPTTAPAGRLSRRAAVRTCAPPAIGVVGATSLNKNNFGTSGRVKSNAGRGNGSEGNPDQDPGNSGAHNKGGG
jgi:hypothetical protein